jgi:hypothetical protein
MSSLYPTVPNFQTVLRAFAQAPDPNSGTGLTEQPIRCACDERGVEFATEDHHIWTPALTLWTFLSQCLAPPSPAPPPWHGLWSCGSQWA